MHWAQLQNIRTTRAFPHAFPMHSYSHSPPPPGMHGVSTESLLFAGSGRLLCFRSGQSRTLGTPENPSRKPTGDGLEPKGSPPGREAPACSSRTSPRLHVRNASPASNSMGVLLVVLVLILLLLLPEGDLSSQQQQQHPVGATRPVGLGTCQEIYDFSDTQDAENTTTTRSSHSTGGGTGLPRSSNNSTHAGQELEATQHRHRYIHSRYVEDETKTKKSGRGETGGKRGKQGKEEGTTTTKEEKRKKKKYRNKKKMFMAVRSHACVVGHLENLSGSGHFMPEAASTEKGGWVERGFLAPTGISGRYPLMH